MTTDVRAARDAFDLFRGLTEAVRRISAHSRLPDGQHRAKPIPYADLMALLERTGRTVDEQPRIVVLIGSTRFPQAFREANFRETLAGHIVLSIGFVPNDDTPHWQNNGITPEQKVQLDQLHKRKIDLADEALVLNVGGYIGDSSRDEIAYAESQGKPVRWLEPAFATTRGPAP
jgi:hypothetical protein